jgi:16S rRNA (cytidine1402-2'-O)-methyltransferase
MRELTKKFEEHLTGTPSELLKRYENSEPKGEFVLLIDKMENYV